MINQRDGRNSFRKHPNQKVLFKNINKWNKKIKQTKWTKSHCKSTWNRCIVMNIFKKTTIYVSEYIKSNVCQISFNLKDMGRWQFTQSNPTYIMFLNYFDGCQSKRHDIYEEVFIIYEPQCRLFIMVININIYFSPTRWHYRLICSTSCCTLHSQAILKRNPHSKHCEQMNRHCHL